MPARGAGDAENDAVSGELNTVGALFEIFLAEYHVSPDELNSSWTEEMLQLYMDKRRARFEYIAEQTEQQTRQPRQHRKKRVSDSDLLQMMGISAASA